MSMAKRAAPLTYDDYVRLPPDRRWELAQGVPRVVPSPNRRHQHVVGRLFVLVFEHVRDHGGGEVFVAPFDAVLSDIDVFQPDIVFVSNADIAVLTDNIRGNPTWVIEVLSNPYYERDKFARYQAAGVGEYWLVNPYEDTLDISLSEPSGGRRAETYTPPGACPSAVPSRSRDRPQIRPGALTFCRR
jgi:Uma2 family endonuclease